MSILGNPILISTNGSGIIPTGTKEITADGTYDVRTYASAHVSVSGHIPAYESKYISYEGTALRRTDVITPASGYDALSMVTLDYNIWPKLQSKSVTFTQNSSITIGPDSDYNGLSNVDINVNIPQPSGVLAINSNGIYDVSTYASANVNVAGGSGTTDIITEKIDIVPNTSLVSSISGSILVSGPYAFLSCRVNFISSGSSEKLIGTIPQDYRSNAEWYFSVGNGGTGTKGTGRITEDGEIYIKFNSTYANFETSWIIAKETVALEYDNTKITSYTGGISINGECAELRIYVPTINVTSGWQTAILTIPSSIRPPNGEVNIIASVINTSGAFRDSTYNQETGAINIYLISSDSKLQIRCAWKIPGNPKEKFWILNPDEMDIQAANCPYISDIKSSNSSKSGYGASFSYVPIITKINNLSQTSSKYYWLSQTGTYNSTNNVAFLGRYGYDRSGLIICKKVPAGKYTTLHLRYEITQGAFSDAHFEIYLIKNPVFGSDVGPEPSQVLYQSTLAQTLQADTTITIDVSNLTEDFYVSFLDWSGFIKIRSLYFD